MNGISNNCQDKHPLKIYFGSKDDIAEEVICVKCLMGDLQNVEKFELFYGCESCKYYICRMCVISNNSLHQHNFVHAPSKFYEIANIDFGKNDFWEIDYLK